MYENTQQDIDRINADNQAALEVVCDILSLQLALAPEKFSNTMKACNFLYKEASTLVRFNSNEFMPVLLEHLQGVTLAGRSVEDKRGVAESIRFLEAIMMARQTYLGTSAKPNVHSN